jgi:hypothetical protein
MVFDVEDAILNTFDGKFSIESIFECVGIIVKKDDGVDDISNNVDDVFLA